MFKFKTLMKIMGIGRHHEIEWGVFNRFDVKLKTKLCRFLILVSALKRNSILFRYKKVR